MANAAKVIAAADRDFANLFWQVTWMSFLTGFAVSVGAAAFVLLIAALGA